MMGSRDILWLKLAGPDSVYRVEITDCFCCGERNLCVYAFASLKLSCGGYYCKGCYFDGGRKGSDPSRGPKYKVDGKFVYLDEVPSERKKFVKFISYLPHNDMIN
jgi:hypothetical protein